MILAATRDAARLFLELGTVTIVLAGGARLAARTGFSSIPLYLVAGIVLGALAPPTLDDALVMTLSEDAGPGEHLRCRSGEVVDSWRDGAR